MSGHLLATSILQKAAFLSATVLPDGRWLLYHAGEHLAITLAAPAGILWELCDGQTPVADLIEQVQAMYPDVPVEQIETEALQTLQSFLEQGLVTRNVTPVS